MGSRATSCSGPPSRRGKRARRSSSCSPTSTTGLGPVRPLGLERSGRGACSRAARSRKRVACPDRENPGRRVMVGYHRRPMSLIESVHAREILDSPREPHPRGRRPARRRRLRPRRRAERRVHRRARGRRAPRRRQPVRRQGRPGRGRQRQRRHRGGAGGVDALDQAGRPRPCSSSTAPTQKSELGANAMLGVSMAVAEGGRRLERAAAVSLPRRAERARAAGADDERHQRRRARRQRARTSRSSC